MNSIDLAIDAAGFVCVTEAGVALPGMERWLIEGWKCPLAV